MPGFTPTILVDGITFPEGPRWHDGRFWFSDMYGPKVYAVDADGKKEVIANVPGRPSGLGWLPDGRMLIVSMQDRRLLRLDGTELALHADLTDLTRGATNDMVVDGQGRAYVGHFGFEMGSEQRQDASIILVNPDGSVRTVADGLGFPNGTVITPDGRTLIVGETFAGRLTAFDIEGDGSLTNRRAFAELGEARPDGICLDAEGAVWVASVFDGQFLRVMDGGAITAQVTVRPKLAVACMLGGEDRRTLYLCTAEGGREDIGAGRTKGFIETVPVDVPGAGWP
jgi:sugar lactone lactonase YvrE